MGLSITEISCNIIFDQSFTRKDLIRRPAHKLHPNIVGGVCIRAISFIFRTKKPCLTIFPASSSVHRDDTVIRMKDDNGFYIDILKPDTDQTGDIVGIRMNVDDFDEAYKMLRERGFKNLYGEETVKTSSSKAAMMVSPSGFNICIIQHIKQ